MRARLSPYLSALLLAACAQAPVAPRLHLPTLQLAPASLGASLSLAQRLTVQQLPEQALRHEAPTEQSLEAQIEIDPQALRLAAFAMNQRVLLLQWDGSALQQQRHTMLPAAVDGARVLRDVQLAYWPAAAIAAALPAGWSVADEGSRRTLAFEGQPQVLIDYSASPRWAGRAELDNRAEGYRLSIESRVLP